MNSVEIQWLIGLRKYIPCDSFSSCFFLTLTSQCLHQRNKAHSGIGARKYSRTLDQAPNDCFLNRQQDALRRGVEQSTLHCGEYVLQEPWVVPDRFWLRESFSRLILDFFYKYLWVVVQRVLLCSGIPASVTASSVSTFLFSGFTRQSIPKKRGK